MAYQVDFLKFQRKNTKKGEQRISVTCMDVAFTSKTAISQHLQFYFEEFYARKLFPIRST